MGLCDTSPILHTMQVGLDEALLCNDLKALPFEHRPT